MGKTVHRAQRSLPTSPRKKRAVVKKLAEKFGVIETCEIKQKEGENSHDYSAVSQFYESGLESTVFPEHKDFVTFINKDPEKERKQKRVFMMTAMEAYSF